MPDEFVSTILDGYPDITVVPFSSFENTTAPQREMSARGREITEGSLSRAGVIEDLDPLLRESVKSLIRERAELDLPAVEGLLETLDTINERYRVILFTASEDSTALASVAAIWAQKRNLRSVLVSHGTALIDPFTVNAHFRTDVMAVFGQRGAEGYIDLGVPPARIVATGNPAWDRYANLVKKRDEIRENLAEKYGLDPGVPLVTFATTWNGGLTASETSDLWVSGVRAFVNACEQLAGLGVKFQAVVKDRRWNKDVGGIWLQEIVDAHQGSSVSYTYATDDTENFVIASDVTVGVSSNFTIESMIAGTPSINLMGHLRVPYPPPFDEASGVECVEPSDLAATIQRLLEDEDFREERLAQTAAAVSYYNLGGRDGRSAIRLGRLLSKTAEPTSVAGWWLTRVTSRGFWSPRKVYRAALHPLRTWKWITKERPFTRA
ncbi:UDP-N-acetyl glucosamine 2-epimerase [Xylanimonas oleitrophica]|nr:UDP-N-acetyl glucosamine 2-epimerase [Xylanimonas oleitrophica]